MSEKKRKGIARHEKLIEAGYYQPDAIRARKENAERAWTAIYVIRFDGDECIKVGIARDPERRLSSYRSHSWRRPRILASCYVKGRALALVAERRLLERFKSFSAGGEWLRLGPTLVIEGNRALCDLCRGDGVEPLTPTEKEAEVEKERAEKMEKLRPVINQIHARPNSTCREASNERR